MAMFLNCQPMPTALKTNVNSAGRKPPGGTVEQPNTREKPMCAGHNHRGAAERGCDNDECVEDPWHDDRANYATDHRQNDTEYATYEVIQSEDRHDRMEAYCLMKPEITLIQAVKAVLGISVAP